MENRVNSQISIKLQDAYKKIQHVFSRHLTTFLATIAFHGHLRLLVSA